MAETRKLAAILAADVAGYVGLPFPGETVLIAASVIVATEHDHNIVSVILTAGGASIIGRMIGSPTIVDCT